MKKILLILSAFMACAGLRAQMTLNDCLVYARDHAHANVINRCEEAKAAAGRRIAAADLMPYVGFSTSGNVSFGRNIDPETNTYDNKKTLSTGFGLQMSLPVFDGLVSINNLKAARVAELRQIQTSQIEADMVSLEVIKAFYNVSYCRAMTEQMERQLARDSTDLRATERGEQLGMRSGADVAGLEAIVAADRYELSNQRGLLEKARLALRAAMGMPLDGPSPELVETDECGAPSAGDDVHPRIAEAELSVRVSEYELRMARGAFSPKISLNGGVSTSYFKMTGGEAVVPAFSRQWKDNMGQYIGFSVSIPLFTGLGNVNRLKRARIELAQSRARLDRTRYEIEKETSEAALDLCVATDGLEAAKRRLDAEETSFRAVRRKYELGSASVLELHTAGARLATARANCEGMRIQKIISAIILSYYKGEKLIK